MQIATTPAPLAGRAPFFETVPNIKDFYAPGQWDYRDFAPTLSTGFCTVFTADHPIGKEFSIKDGSLSKRTLGSLASGSFTCDAFEDAEDLAELLAGLSPHQVLTASTPRHERPFGDFVTQQKAKLNPALMHRGKEHFGLQRGLRGFLTVDYDPAGEPLSKSELWRILQDTIPGVDEAGVVYSVSGSSFIYRGENRVRGLSGQRFYILTKDVGDIARAMGALQKRLWLGGHGRIAISSAGSLLKRTIADESFGQDARLDYAGGAVCLDGLEQRRPAPDVLNRDGWLDTVAALPDLSPEEEVRYQQIVAAAEAAAKPEAEIVKAEWCRARAKEHATRKTERGGDYGAAFEEGLSIARAAHGGVLLGDFPIELDDGEVVTVASLLDDRERYHHRLTLDPIERDYRGGHVAGKLYLFGACPNLHSFAHGGRTFRLSYQPSKVLLQAGRAAENALEYLRRLAKADVFVKGGVPVRIMGGVKPLTNTAAMGFELGTRFATFRLNSKGDEVPADPPESVVKMLISAAPDELRTVRSYIRHPFATEHEIITSSGYHEATGTYAEFDPSDYVGVPAVPDRAEVVDALKTLWRPWSRFAFASNDDRAAMLGAILGIVCRPALDIAPGVLCDAPVAGSGKTFLAMTLGALALGRSPDVAAFAYGETDVELKKRLTASCIAGDDVFIYDNVIGNFNSAALAGCLTTGTIKDRILGSSVDYVGPGPGLVVLTANNLQLGVDLAVRFLRVRLDHRVANPAVLRFDFHPVERVIAERATIIRACLVVLRAFQLAGEHHGLGGYRMAAWDRLVRSCVVWLGRMGFVRESGIAEPEDVFDPAAGMLAATVDVGSGDETKAAWFEYLHGLTVKDGLSVGDLLTVAKGDYRFGELTADVLGGKPLTRTTLKTALMISVDQVVGGYRLMRWRDERKETNLFAVTRV